MAKSSSVHISGGHFAAIVIDGTAKRWKVSGYESGDIAKAAEGENPMAPTVVAVTAAMKKVKSPREPVTLTISSGDAVFRSIQLPFTGDDAIEKVLKFESESHFHQLNIDDVVVEHVSVGEHKQATDIIVAASPKKSLRSHIEALDRAGYDPMYAELDALALYNAVVGSGSVPETGSALVVHLGHEDTLAILIEDRRLRTVRSMRTGLVNLQQAVARDLGIPEGAAAEKVSQLNSGEPAGNIVTTYEEAKPRGELEKNPAELERDLMTDRRNELVRRLQRESLRTAAAEARTGPDIVYVCGEGASIPGLVASLGESLQVPAQELDVFNNIDGAPADMESRRKYVIALGGALKGIGVDFTKTNFRQEDLRFAKKLESLKIPLAAIAATIAFTLLLENIYMFREIDSKKQHIATQVQVADAIFAGRSSIKRDALKKYDADPMERRIRLYNAWVDQELRTVKDKYGVGGASFTKPQSAFEAMQRVFKVISTYQDDLGLFVIDRLTAQTDLRNANSQGVDIRFTITFLGDPTSCSERCTEFRKRLKAAKWCVDSMEGNATPVEGGGGVTYEGLTVRVDLTREIQDRKEASK